MNAAAVPENPYPPRPAILYGVLNTIAVVGLIVIVVTAPFSAVGRATSEVLGAIAAFPFARRARRRASDHPSSVSYFGTAA